MRRRMWESSEGRGKALIRSHVEYGLGRISRGSSTGRDKYARVALCDLSGDRRGGVSVLRRVVPSSRHSAAAFAAIIGPLRAGAGRVRFCPGFELRVKMRENFFQNARRVVVSGSEFIIQTARDDTSRAQSVSRPVPAAGYATDGAYSHLSRTGSCNGSTSSYSPSFYSDQQATLGAQELPSHATSPSPFSVPPSAFIPFRFQSATSHSPHRASPVPPQHPLTQTASPPRYTYFTQPSPPFSCSAASPRSPRSSSSLPTYGGRVSDAPANLLRIHVAVHS
ncbi:hypothetical protein HYPSUDRAFT_203050 [Hypholoma sublateritium FD-334 SS-4]|uniref:Uncharacterized protein n=1 Tax=Hypholoma sublateritium (strain FD-334 SS-4) TaxID=945553 RepID=A0A0D2PN29_HYPSF|nr:hypothetical protein HYPSUDRAFT_203050 [Hypholoma sublateritium FD-334 SS-4]